MVPQCVHMGLHIKYAYEFTSGVVSVGYACHRATVMHPQLIIALMFIERNKMHAHRLCVVTRLLVYCRLYGGARVGVAQELMAGTGGGRDHVRTIVSTTRL